MNSTAATARRVLIPTTGPRPAAAGREAGAANVRRFRLARVQAELGRAPARADRHDHLRRMYD